MSVFLRLLSRRVIQIRRRMVEVRNCRRPCRPNPVGLKMVRRRPTVDIYRVGAPRLAIQRRTDRRQRVHRLAPSRLWTALRVVVVLQRCVKHRIRQTMPQHNPHRCRYEAFRIPRRRGLRLARIRLKPPFRTVIRNIYPMPPVFRPGPQVNRTWAIIDRVLPSTVIDTRPLPENCANPIHMKNPR